MHIYIKSFNSAGCHIILSTIKSLISAVTLNIKIVKMIFFYVYVEKLLGLEGIW